MTAKALIVAPTRRVRTVHVLQDVAGQIVTGVVTNVEDGQAVIDVGVGALGRVLREFTPHSSGVSVGDHVEVFVDRVINARGEAMLSHDRVLREASWDRLELQYAESNKVEGVIFGRVKGGFTVDLYGAVAFLPGSHVDVRPVRDVGPLMDIPQPFHILKLDRERGSIVVSRRAVLEESRAKERSDVISTMAKGQVIDGEPSESSDLPHSQIPGPFVLASAQMLLDAVDQPYKLHSIIAELMAWKDYGMPVWLGALRALYRQEKRYAADRLGEIIHEVLVVTGHHALVPRLFLAQAAAYGRAGDDVARSLFAIEAGAGFVELEDWDGAETALCLARC